MAKIVPKLNLNKVPQNVENNSLVFAKNIKLASNNIIGPDNSIENIELVFYARKDSNGNYILYEDIESYNQAGIIPSNQEEENNVTPGLLGDGNNSSEENNDNPMARYQDFFDDEFFDELPVINEEQEYNEAYAEDLNRYNKDKSTDETVINNTNAPGLVNGNSTSNVVNAIQNLNIDVREFNIDDSVKYSIIGHIVGLNNIIYLFTAIWSNSEGTGTPFYRIVEYNEVTKNYKILSTDWNYSGGKITGCVTTNMSNEIILSVAEYFDKETDKKVPLKHLNITKIKENSNKYPESLYTQAPVIPLTNLIFRGYYQCAIPNGVYQFFVRYKISKNNYTKWFPCSKELYATNIKKVDTVQGTVKYMETFRDANVSFILEVEHINNNAKQYYEGFQLGFLLSHDDTVVAREWKTFDINSNDLIYFDYLQQDIKDIEQTDLLASVYELFNVKNITLFKDKLYIANYIETNVNGINQNKLKGIASNITVTLKHIGLPSTDTGKFDNKPLNELIPGTTDTYVKAGDKMIADYFKNSTFDKEKKLVGSESKSFVIAKFNARYNADYEHWEAHIVCIYSYEIYNQKFNNINSDRVIEKVHGFTSDNDINNTTYFEQAGRTITDKENHPLNNNNTYDGVTVKGITGFWYGGALEDWSLDYHAEGDYYYHTESGDKDTIANVIRNKNLERFNVPSGGITAVYVEIISDNGSNLGYVLLDFYGNNGAYSYSKSFNSNNHNAEADAVAISAIAPYIKGASINTNGNSYFYFEKGNLKGKLVSYKVTYDEYIDFTDKRETDGYGEHITYSQDISLNYKVNSLIRELSIKPSILSAPKDGGIENQINTLLPFTKYEFFIHFVQANGIITNGYKINNDEPVSLDVFNTNLQKGIIYPSFGNINTKDLAGTYVSYFFSIRKIGADVAECFNINPINNNAQLQCHCLELDTLLYPLLDNISIINKDNVLVENVADYHPSYDTEENTKWFGDSGKLIIEGIEDLISMANNPLTGDTIIRRHTEDYSRMSVLTEDSTFSDLIVNNGDTIDYKQCFIYQVINDNITKSIWIGYNTTDEEIKNALSGITSIERFVNNNVEQIKLHFSLASATNMKIYGGEIECYNGNIIDVIDVYSYRTRTFANGTYGITKGNSVSILEDYIKTFSPYEISRNDEEGVILYNDGAFWVRSKANNSGLNNNSPLTKLTPYIPISVINDSVIYDNYENLNSPGFLCKVYKPTARDASIYVSGSDIYDRDVNAGVSQENMSIKSNDGYVGIYPTDAHYIYSNYNLNCLQLSEDLVPKIRSYSLDPESDDSKKTERQIVLLFQSSTLSDIYKLPSMYKDYLKKYFYEFEKDVYTKFDKTIRASYVDVDKENNLGYYFNPTDFYNIASNKGDIIRLFAINNSVIVHTEHSMFKFNGNSTINASDTDITMAESDIFDIGISEIFDAEHGYAGIKKKEHGIATFEYYLFYDALAKKIYGYDGSPNLQRLSDSIQYLLDKLITDNTEIVLAGDTDNNRIFINIRNVNGNVCLSYNLLTKSFISIHDIDFTQSFNTRTKTYLVLRTNETENTDSTKPSYYDIIGSFVKNKYLNYGEFYKTSILYINDMGNGRFYREACVDIIYNDTYEKIKVLNFIQWICSEIKNYINDETDESNEFDLLGNTNVHNTEVINVSEEKLTKYSGDYLRIYSDQCHTKRISLTRDENGIRVPNIQNDENLTVIINNKLKVNEESYSYPRYNNGIWSFNYFNDVKNKTDIFKYGEYYISKVTGTRITKQQYNNLSDANKAHYKKQVENPDNNSLMYGKYFVVRLVFRIKNFKLENVVFNVNDYGKS